jgi:molecular chaperone DnaK (HSP70)
MSFNSKPVIKEDVPGSPRLIYIEPSRCVPNSVFICINSPESHATADEDGKTVGTHLNNEQVKTLINELQKYIEESVN